MLWIMTKRIRRVAEIVIETMCGVCGFITMCLLERLISMLIF